ncbi:hypothetical protein G7Y89_g9529 [Cudoniella acicularis]|uniref:Uncharacterized protein n=1 Tax=Cudoniella acicularis TaxID=354080 RepID=A0A8H4REH5_9HELO|nr:hypothetical protein G7Y89_g9529 [Cudoniella acicularis]
MADATLSSPDPLNDSPAFQAPSKTRRSSTTRKSLPLQGSSPKKQMFELDVGDQISPQKIRVTVEAGKSSMGTSYAGYVEGDDDSPLLSHAPKNRRRERTTTTTIPLKGFEDSGNVAEPTPKRGRGRPRKSMATPVPAKKRGRASTPTRKLNTRRKSVGESIGEENNDENIQIGDGVEIVRAKGGSRSRSRKGASRKSAAAISQPFTSDSLEPSTRARKGRGRKKAAAQEDDAISEISAPEAGGQNEMGDNETELSVANSPSAYSTIRSTTTTGYDQEDIVIARFSPGNETPRRTGWSSPRVIDASEQLDSRLDVVDRSLVGERSYHDHYEEEDLMVASELALEEEDYTAPSTEQDIQYEDEEVDGLGNMPEFDTILESEGFSMISVESVPSLRDHLSSPANQEESHVPREPKNRSLLPIQETETARNDSFSSIPGEVLEAATPRPKGHSKILSVETATVEDSVPSMAAQVLESATPAHNPRVQELLSVNRARGGDSFSSVAPETLETAAPARSQQIRHLAATIKQDEDYDDSFSAIPDAILDAATPARPTYPNGSRPASSGCNPDTLKIPVPEQKVASSQATKGASPRLLTPEETPSPTSDDNNLQDSKTNGKSLTNAKQLSKKEPAQESSMIQSQMPSSPPSLAPRRYTYTAHLRQNRQLHQDLTETPSITFSSPSLPPPLHQIKEQTGYSQRPADVQRPTLSPIARAGRVLQNVIVPSSPRSRSQSLRSPFKSPAAERKSSSIAREFQAPILQDRRGMPLPKLDLTGNLAVFPPQETRWSRQVNQDDPFRNDGAATTRHLPLPQQKQQYALGLPEQRHLSDSRFAKVKSEIGSIRSEDAMSWQTEDEIYMDDNATSMANNINSSLSARIVSPDESDNAPCSSGSEVAWDRKLAAERDAVSKQIGRANVDQVIVINSDDGQAEAQEDDDEDFGLLLETMNSSSPLPMQREEPPKETKEKPRRSKIPSPWRKNSKRLVYSDELSHLSSPVATQPSFAGDIVDDAVPKPVTVRRASTSYQDSASSDDLDLSGWQIPQKSNFQPRVRQSGNLDLSALLGTSPAKQLPVLSTASSKASSQLERNSEKSQSSEPATSQEPMSFVPIPQKMGFRPRARTQVSNSLISSPPKGPSLGLFSGLPMAALSKVMEPSSSKPLTPSSPSRHNLVGKIGTLSVNRSSPDSSNDSSMSTSSNNEKENQNIAGRTLKWTQTIPLTSKDEMKTPPLASPTKSCLRSPMKTPSTYLQSSADLSPSKAVTFVSSSPLPSSPPHRLLSSTTWSKDHWILLETILQTWKPENQDLPGSENSEGRKRRNSTRVISKLLGRTVRSDGDSMVMEQWHLEVVDQFRGHVPGWEEKAIAMRVFSLIAGAERRKRRADAEAGRGEQEKTGMEGAVVL